MRSFNFSPVRASGIMRVNGYVVWCGSMVRTKDGRCHLFLSLWEEKYGFEGWVIHSKIGYAIADEPAGEYKFKGIILEGSNKENAWDRDVVHNPWVVLHDGKFLLYYTGNYGNGVYMDHVHHQQIGLAVADDPMGPWSRRDSPFLPTRAGAFDETITTNPSVSRMPDGRFIMIYKCASKKPPYNGKVSIGAAFAAHPEGPFLRHPEPIFQKGGVTFAAEDPCVYCQDGTMFCLMKDMGSFYAKDQVRSLIRFESKNGTDWEPSNPFVFLSRKVNFEEGGVREIFRLERPFLYLEDGTPRVFFAGAKPDEGNDAAFNFHMKIEGF